MREEIDVLLDRAGKFERACKYFYENGIYDLSAFHVEQAFQLYLKYILAKRDSFKANRIFLHTFKVLSERIL